MTPRFPPSFVFFAAVAVAVAVAGAGCTQPTEARHILRTDVILDYGIVVEAFDDGSVEARESPTGIVRWRNVDGAGRDRGYGVDPAAIVECPMAPLGRGNILVVRSKTVDLVRASNGVTVSQIRRREAGRPSVCPARTPDGGYVVPIPAFHGSGLIAKHRWDGRPVWQHANPDIGPLTAPITVDPRSGDIVVASDTHVMAISPSGQTNWVRPHAPR